MKKFSIFLLIMIAFVGFTSCEHDDDVVFTAQPDPEGIVFMSSTAESYTLTSETANNIAERFVWSEVDFDAPTTVTYELQGSSDADFSSFNIIGTTGENNLGVTVSQLMSLATEAGLDNDPETEMPNAGDIYFRVRAYAGTDGSNGLNATSEVMSLRVVLPEAVIEEEENPAKMNLFFVGDATAAGWNNNNNNTPMFRDPENDNIFNFSGRFAGGDDVEGFKLLETPGAWQPQWGGTDGTLGVNTGDSDDPAAFSVEDDAYYTLSLNTEDMTYTFEAMDVSAATMYDMVGIIGTATTGTDEGWNDDMDMTQSDFDSHIWYMNDVELFDGELKFRANNAWDVSWGASTPISGQGANANDPNIPVTAGVYDIWFNDLTARYILIPAGE